MSAQEVDAFRVYNRTERVGVEWRMLGTTFRPWSMVILMVVLVCAAAITGVAIAAGWLVVGIALAVGSGVALFLIIVMVARLGQMGDLPERVQIGLLLHGAARPVEVNFFTPDSALSASDFEWADSRSSDSIVRNY